MIILGVTKTGEDVTCVVGIGVSTPLSQYCTDIASNCRDTYFPGLSRRPPYSAWQHPSIYLVNPSRW